MSQSAIANVLFFGSPFLAAAIGGSLLVVAFGAAPSGLAAFAMFAWMGGILFAGLGSAAGGMLYGGSDDRQTLLGVVGFLGGAASYAVISVIPLVLYSWYVMVFEFV